MLNEKFPFGFKVAVKWKLTKSHATRLKSAKYKIRVIKEQLLKWMSYNQTNQSHSLSYDETSFLAIKNCLFLFIAYSYFKKPNQKIWKTFCRS